MNYKTLYRSNPSSLLPQPCPLVLYSDPYFPISPSNYPTDANIRYQTSSILQISLEIGSFSLIWHPNWVGRVESNQILLP
jgi:hypothetical protein